MRKLAVWRTSQEGLADRQMVVQSNQVATAHTLAKSGSFTLVEFYIDNCPACQAARRSTLALLKKRPELVSVIVDMSWTQRGCAEQRCEERRNEEYRRLRVCHPPQFVIYDPSKKQIARDTCESHAATTLYTQWLIEASVLDPEPH